MSLAPFETSQAALLAANATSGIGSHLAASSSDSPTLS